MITKRRKEITIETHETTIIRFPQNQEIFFCEWCQKNMPHFSEGQVISILSDSESAILELAESKEIHLRETNNGFFVCANSLLGLENKQI